MHIKPSVLIVDDENTVCELLSDELSEQGYLCDAALDGNIALDKLKSNTFDVALVDIRLPTISGIELLQEISQNCRNTVVIMITAINDVDTAVKTMKLGAADYIVKPFDLERIKSSIIAALEMRSCVCEWEGYYILDNDKEEDFDEMNAIAQGVEAKLDLYDNRFNAVNERTIKIAKELEIDEDQIQRWAESRARANRKNQTIVHKFEQSSMAQIKMGITKKYQCDEDSWFNES